MSSTLKPQSSSPFPFDGELYPARNKRFKELVFFVHFYEGNKKQLLRHIRLVNGFGFDAFAFHLHGTHQDFLSLKLPISPKGSFGIKHLYADQIEMLLNLLPQEKIVFSFSNPSGSAIEALARRRCSDIKALICDSGPSNRFLNSAIRLYQQNNPSQAKPFSYAFAPIMGFGWSPYLHQDIHKDLKIFPAYFPILSIRGWKDALISPQHIDEIFEPHKQLQWRKLDLPLAGHILGLRDFRDDYAPALENFLNEVATPIHSESL